MKRHHIAIPLALLAALSVGTRSVGCRGRAAGRPEQAGDHGPRRRQPRPSRPSARQRRRAATAIARHGHSAGPRRARAQRLRGRGKAELKRARLEAKAAHDAAPKKPH